MSENNMCDMARAYPTGDAQGQHPAPVGNGQGLSHQTGRVRRKKRARSMREIRLRYASWNIGTMTGRARELADVLKRRRINIACVQETKWKGAKAREIGEGYKFYYNGSDGKRNGVGIVVDNVLKECVIAVNRISDRIIAVKVVVENVVLNIVSVYAPQTGCEDVIKEKFWEDFDAYMMNIPDNEDIVVGGDFNGHVGDVNQDYERVHGGWGYGSRNLDGEAVLQAATAFDLAITNTWFKKKPDHLITYKSGHHATQVDYFLVKRNNLKCVKDCKVLPGEHLVSQHRLLIMDTKLTVALIKKKDRPPPKIRWRMIEKKESASLFKKEVVDKMIEMTNMDSMSVDECWTEMAGCIRRIAKKVFGESKGKGLIDKDTWWWNDNVQTAIKEKKSAFKEWQRVKDDESLSELKKASYKECKRKAKKEVAIARAQTLDRLYDTLDSTKGQKEIYRIVKAREKRARDLTHIKCMKNEEGMILYKDDEIKERWKVYFDKLMNNENRWSGLLKNVDENIGLIREISADEVRKAVGSMKNGKAVGPDGIPVEVWKVLGEDGYAWLTLFFNKLLHKEVIPQEWCISSLVPIFKNKGDIQDCNNYRGIKLMSHSMKVWEKVIEKRLREESEITQNQFGFMPGRGTTDAIFALRQLCEKYRQAHRNLHMVYIDLEKAYDRVPRQVLWWAMKEKGVPRKYVELIRAMYCRSSTYVRSSAGNTNIFNVAVGLHQGSALSPYLFLLIMDALTSDLQEEAPWCMLFADDIVLISESEHEVQIRLDRWQQNLENVGLKISRTKTEYMFCDFGGLSRFNAVTLDGVALPVCSDFRYLGSLVQNDGEIDRTVKHRINTGWMKWRQVTGTICDPQLPLRLKGKIYKTMIRPAVMYGSECWAIKAMNERQLHAAEMRMLRGMCGVTRMDKIRNEYIRGSLKVAPVTEKLEGNRLSWYGHVMRREENHVVRRVLGLDVDGYKKRGRPRKRWMDCVKGDMARKEVNTEMTGDRDVWKKKTYCADPK